MFCAFLPKSLAQSWLDLRAQGANYYQIKEAFYRDRGALVKEMQAEIRLAAFAGRGLDEHDDDARYSEVIQFQRWANIVEPRVKESGGDMSAIGKHLASALRERNSGLQTRGAATWKELGPSQFPLDLQGAGRVFRCWLRVRT